MADISCLVIKIMTMFMEICCACTTNVHCIICKIHIYTAIFKAWNVRVFYISNCTAFGNVFLIHCLGNVSTFFKAV